MRDRPMTGSPTAASILDRLIEITERNHKISINVSCSNLALDELHYLEYLLMIEDMNYYDHWVKLKSSMEFDPNEKR
jgi:hypothetical protein